MFEVILQLMLYTLLQSCTKAEQPLLLIIGTSCHSPSGRDGLTFSKFSLGKSYADDANSTLVK